MTATKLIVLRGPSGAGKTSVARALRAMQAGPTALIEQDYLRRVLLKNAAREVNVELMRRIIFFALENSPIVILEGILDKGRYSSMFEELLRIHPIDNYFFYFDVSFEETLRRHNSRPHKDEFGEAEMRQWYKDKDLLEFVEEDIIPERNSLEESVAQISSACGLGNDFK